MKIGLEAISFDIPKHYLNMSDLAYARGVDPAKYLIGLGQKEMSVASPCEDTVVLGASAAQRIFKDFNVDPDSVSMLIVGTETSVDHSKPVSSYIHQIIGLSSACRVFEIKHACYGGMAGLGIAVNYILSGRAMGKKVLVIASDIARYGKNTAGEPTQGAGAVAMLVSDNPLLLEIDYQFEGFFSKQVMDFWRPLYSKEAIADGHYSIMCYLEALKGSYKMFRQSVIQQFNTSNEANEGLFSDKFSACLYHVPFVKMAHKAHQRLLEIDSEFLFKKKTNQFNSAVLNYQNRVGRFLELNASVGNIYTGALFLSLYNLLKQYAKELKGKQVSLFSYGSGCTAEFLSGKISDGAAEVIEKSTSMQLFAERKLVSVAQYEEMMDASAKMDLNNEERIFDPSIWKLNRSIVYDGTRDNKRIYRIDGKILNEEYLASPKTLMV
jgi:hydroxymethylglutaryl-CoA synthase